jgi:hypothetical protein
MATQKLIVQLSKVPAVLNLSVPAQKHNTECTMMYHVDDGGHFGVQRAIQQWSDNGFKTSDGCGNYRSYTADIAVNVGLGDPSIVPISNDHDWREVYPQKAWFEWLLSKGGSILNHSNYHTGENPLKQLQDINTKYLKVLGYKVSGVVVPGQESGYGNAAIVNGDVFMTSEGDKTFDVMQTLRYHKIAPDNPIIAYENEAIWAPVRDGSDWDDPSKTDFLMTQVDLCFNGGRNFWPLFSHYNAYEAAKEAEFMRLWNYVKSFPNYQDRILMCSMREWMEYRLMRLATMSHVLVGTTLTISFDDSSIPENHRNNISWKDVCVNINTDAQILGVTVDGFDRSTFNPSTGLVNGFKRITNWTGVAPDPDPFPDPDPEPEPSGSFYAGIYYYI